MDGFRRRAAHGVRCGMEVLVLALVCLSPWAFGATNPFLEFYLHAGVAALLALWAVRVLLERHWSLSKCPVALCVAGLFLAAVVQMLPLPGVVLECLSPGTVRLRDQLLPAQPEVLSPVQPSSSAVQPAAGTISLYPGATRTGAIRLLAVFLLFAVVRNNVASAAALRRLAIALLVNGSLLALFALVQDLRSPPHTLYGIWQSEGWVFGPFVCRNHFAFYVNICVGLGAGLLLSYRENPSQQPGHPAGSGAGLPGWFRAVADLLQAPRALWVVAALALMLGSVALSLSRGGFLALGGAGLVCLVAGVASSSRWSRLVGGLVLVLLALGVVAWSGADRVRARLDFLGTSAVLEDGRLAVWRRALPLVRDYPLWGTGLGTFAHVEPLQRCPGDDPAVVWDHAHNDYLEALVEGGLLRLALSLAATGLVLRCGFRAVRRYRGQPAGGLALGAVFGFLTVVLHSLVDFGLHVPAITFLTTVLCAYLCALGPALPGRADSGDRVDPARAPGGQSAWRLRGPFAAAVALTALLLGVVLGGESWRVGRAEQFRLAAARLGLRPGPDVPEQQAACLEAAIRCTPEDAFRHLEYAEFQFARFRQRREELAKASRARTAAQAVAHLTCPGCPGGGICSVLSGVSAVVGSAAGEAERFRKEVRVPTDRYVRPALRHYLAARDLCPLLVLPHLRIAAHVGDLEKAGPRGAYLERARLVRPSDPAILRLVELQELQDGEAPAPE